MLKTEAIKTFLTKFAHPDLADLYNHDMEVQVIVAKGQGERIEGDFKGRVWHGYTDGVQTWKPIRIPVNANTEPEFTDSPMMYDLASHAEGIGMTGWDWRSRTSRWVAFDFDAITGHSDKHAKKLTDTELDQIKAMLLTIPYVTIRRSTGGRGLHVYVFVEPTETANHNEHAAVARAVLSNLSGLAGFDFSTKIDACGGNMWVWHRKLATSQGGLEIIKLGTERASVPPNWEDYTKVVTGRRQKNLPKFIEEQVEVRSDIESTFEELTGQRLRVRPDLEHRRLMDWVFENYPNASWWDAENHMLVTHTAILKEAHEALSLRGKFETLATGSDKGFDHNAFAYPISRGGWSVRRYTLGVAEHAIWEQDGSGWTKCTYNRDPDLHSACKANEGLERRDGAYCFTTVEQAQKAALLLGIDLGVPTWVLGQPCTMLMHKSGDKLIVEIEKSAQNPPIAGWLVKGKKFEKVFSFKRSEKGEPEIHRIDEMVRHLVSESGSNAGWVIKGDGLWRDEPLVHVKEWLKSQYHKDPSMIVGNSVAQAWTLVNRPFKEEYPRDRQWNRDAPQLRYKPSLNKDNLKYGSWLKVLNHCGRGLDEAIRNHQWCKANGILNGADYLKCWIASMFQEPLEPLPYLFLYGPQNSGKSIFHEALQILMTRGVVRADQALASSNGFNGELEACVLAVVEETDLKKNQTAGNRIKDWVTSKHISIHAKSKQPFMMVNTTHWVQTNNSHLACPVFPGDTRITMSYVDVLKPDALIPKKVFMPIFEAEASDFVAEILSLELPVSNDRLNIPCIVTMDKQLAEAANMSPLETFLEERVYYVEGERVKFSDFFDRFLEFLDPAHVHQWTKRRVGSELPPRFIKGRDLSTSQHWIGNISFEDTQSKNGQKYVVVDGKLVLVPSGVNQ